MRSLAWLCVFCALAEAAPRGRWGEDPKLVPSFAPTEERRAPKVPAGDGLYAAFSDARTVGAVDGALLVCKVDVQERARRRKKGFGDAIGAILTLGTSEIVDGPDLTVTLGLRGEHPLVLWGPAKHWHSYVSFPAVKLSPGDAIWLSLLDRNTFSHDESFGRVRGKFDGQSPIHFQHQRWDVSCAVLTAEEARERAAPWLATVDKQLDTIEKKPFEPNKYEFGFPAVELDQLKGHFRNIKHEGNFRYAAGFFGWEHPEIQTRLERMRSIEESWHEKMRARVAALRGELPEDGKIDTKTATLSAHGFHCEKKRDDCRVLLDIEWRTPTTCAAARSMFSWLHTVDEKGQAARVEIVTMRDEGESCNRVELKVSRDAVLFFDDDWATVFARLRD
jgi:hypothetical protein